ncbi:MAG: T9SS type A sorting domain-containing protein [Flavobacteriales bacterium]
MNLKLFIITGLISSFSFSQTPIINRTMSVNNLTINASSDGTIHYDGLFSTSQMPSGDSLTCNFLENLWMGGIDENAELRLAGQTYRQGGSDFWPGPVGDTYDQDFETTYNNVWHLKKVDIENHRLNYSSIGYIVPDDIANWPANGNVSNGENLRLAPFSDINNNDIYEPELGDFPLIRGDEAMFIIYNDQRENHGSSGGQKIKAEIHLMIYAYDTDDFNKNVYYMHYDIYNRNQTLSFSNFTVSNFNDFDLGLAWDDFNGTHVTENMVYVYNGDSIDEDNYGQNPPIYATKLLNMDMTSSISFNNSSNLFNGSPGLYYDYFNYMKGKWKTGGSIINPIDSSITNFILPGDSDTTNQANWSEINLGNVPGDRRMLLTTNITNFSPDQPICLDYAGIYVRDTTVFGLDQIESLVNVSQQVQNFYDNQYIDCQDVSDLSLIDEIDNSDIGQVSLFQFDQTLEITLKEPLDFDLQITITDALGKQLYSNTLESNEMNKTINTSQISSQIVFVTLQSKNSAYSNKVIIK